MATQDFINECKNRANANRLCKFDLSTLVSKNLLKNTNVNSGDNNYWQSYSTFDETTGTLTRSTTGTSETFIFHKYNLKNNTTYTISCLAKSNGYVKSFEIYVYNSTTSKIYYLPSELLSTSYQKFSLTFTTDSDTDFTNANIRFDNNGSSENGTTATLTIKDVMLVEGVDTEFVPYGSKEINQSNYLSSIELKDSCYTNDTIIGSLYTKSADVKLLNLPVNTELAGEKITPEIGVMYDDESTEYITFDEYTIESINDEQTASNTGFTAMNGGALLDKEYICSLSFEGGVTHTINEFYQDACSQLGLTPTDETFTNSEIELTGNPFQNKETIRTVLSEVEKASCSIIKFDWTNETISLTWLDDEISYEFNTSDYSTLEGSLTQYGPLNVIILANSQLNGENVVMTDSESVAEYGEHQIIIDSPYFLYTEALRNQAIEAIYEKLDGLTYYDVKLTTPYGKPFLEIGNKIRINTNENQVLDTYVLTHTFTYDGTFQSIIESPALTQEEQTVKNEFKGNSIKERIKRTEVIVDKTTGDITALTERVITDEENTYSIDQVNELVQNAQTGITNTFSEAGGNNIFRNTGLWFESGDNNNPYEFWNGIVSRISEDNSSNHSALLLQNNTLYQDQNVSNGNYTISFKYKKVIPLSEISVKINDIEYELTEDDETEFMQTIEVSNQHIKVEFISDTDDSCEIYDLMVNAGSVKLAYSQNQNETTTDTVNISKGITITSSDDENVVFKANADGVRIYEKNDMTNPKTKFTNKGTETNYIEVKDEAIICDVLIQKIGSHTWFTKI